MKLTLPMRARFVSISAGRDHLLALTSAGRTFAHPITKNANSHGQLGFRKFDIANPASNVATSRLHVELTPRAVTDRSKVLALLRQSSTPTLLPVSENLADGRREHQILPQTVELPSLKGVRVDQIAAEAAAAL